MGSFHNTAKQREHLHKLIKSTRLGCIACRVFKLGLTSSWLPISELSLQYNKFISFLTPLCRDEVSEEIANGIKTGPTESSFLLQKFLIALYQTTLESSLNRKKYPTGGSGVFSTNLFELPFPFNSVECICEVFFQQERTLFAIFLEVSLLSLIKYFGNLGVFPHSHLFDHIEKLLNLHSGKAPFFQRWITW